MLAEIYLSLFILICFGLLLWGLVRAERIYQYPFFMGGILVSFLLPQAISILLKPEPLTQRALELAILMSCLCAGMCLVGYQFPANYDLLKLLDFNIDSKKLLRGGIVFTALGLFFLFLVFQQPEEARASTTWTGRITIYAFFSSLIYPGLAIILISTLQRPSVIKVWLTVIAAIIPVQTMLAGRREQTATLILTVALSLYFSRRILPPRWLAIGAVFFTLVALPLTTAYRTALKTGDWSELQAVNPVDNLESFVAEGDYLELRGAAALMEAIVETGQYGLGAGYWNGLVFQYVPAQLLGRGIKYNLMIESGSRYTLKSALSYINPNGLTITGIADTFVQFDYFGCLVFLATAYLFKTLWVSATQRQSVIAQLFYISLFTPAMKAITHSTVTLLNSIVFAVVFIGGLALYARKK